MKMLPLIAAIAISLPAAAQSSHVDYFSSQQVQQKLAALAPQAKDKGSSGATLGDYGSHALKLSIRTKSGGAEKHAHFDDVFVVTQGKATLITGGTIVDPHEGKNGETEGKKIRNGKSQVISVGDVVNIPAGTPHQLIIAPGTLYSSIVIKVKEQ